MTITKLDDIPKQTQQELSQAYQEYLANIGTKHQPKKQFAPKGTSNTFCAEFLELNRTEKAVLLEYEGITGWIPVSQIVDGKDGIVATGEEDRGLPIVEVTMSAWIARKHWSFN